MLVHIQDQEDKQLVLHVRKESFKQVLENHLVTVVQLVHTLQLLENQLVMDVDLVSINQVQVKQDVKHVVREQFHLEVQIQDVLIV